MIVGPMLRGDDPGIVTPPDDTNYTPIIFDATASPEQLYGSNLEFIVGSAVSIGDSQSEPPKFEFKTNGFVVKAKVVENYPDLYYKLDVNSEYKPRAYRLIKMEAVEVINGENVPQYFLYLIPDLQFVDMSVYDSLLISMSQIGAENYVLKNDTKKQMEAFELPVFSDDQGLPELGNIIAFSDGVFDESLWQNSSWIYGYQFARYYLDEPQNSDLVVQRGDSVNDVIAEINDRIAADKQWWGDNYRVPTLLTLSFSTKAAKDAVEYVKPFENGVFSQQCHNGYNNLFIFTRFINGCQTEETIIIDPLTEEVTYSEVRYTNEDMSKMENISAHLSEKAKEYAEQMPTPPHTDPEGKNLLCLNLYAWYAKVDGKLYGVVKTVWRHMEEDNWYLQYHDEDYILYDMSASTAINISREDLVSILGSRNVSREQFGVVIELPEE